MVPIKQHDRRAVVASAVCQALGSAESRWFQSSNTIVCVARWPHASRVEAHSTGLSGGDRDTGAREPGDDRAIGIHLQAVERAASVDPVRDPPDQVRLLATIEAGGWSPGGSGRALVRCPMAAAAAPRGWRRSAGASRRPGARSPSHFASASHRDDEEARLHRGPSRPYRPIAPDRATAEHSALAADRSAIGERTVDFVASAVADDRPRARRKIEVTAIQAAAPAGIPVTSISLAAARVGPDAIGGP